MFEKGSASESRSRVKLYTIPTNLSKVNSRISIRSVQHALYHLQSTTITYKIGQTS